jgi:hypothetical protein
VTLEVVHVPFLSLSNAIPWLAFYCSAMRRCMDFRMKSGNLVTQSGGEAAIISHRGEGCLKPAVPTPLFLSSSGENMMHDAGAPCTSSSSTECDEGRRIKGE